jgi:sigma-E factor negative regulatory protein RseB
MNKLSLLLAVIFSGFISTSLMAMTEEDMWIAQMIDAAENAHYQGVYQISQGEHVSEFEIVHKVVDGEVREKLVPKSAIALEVIRHGDVLTCLIETKHTGDIRTIPTAPFSRLNADDADGLSMIYDVNALSMGEFLGYKVDVIELTAKNKDRYNYRIWLESESKLLLKMQTLALAGGVLEEFTFTRVDIGNVNDSALQPSLKNVEAISQSLSESKSMLKAGGYMPGWLPKGFALKYSDQSMKQGMRTNKLVYSDGLSSFSVFIINNNGDLMDFTKQQGATLAMMKVVDDIVVSFVGELPLDTSERIIASLMKMD